MRIAGEIRDWNPEAIFYLYRLKRSDRYARIFRRLSQNRFG